MVRGSKEAGEERVDRRMVFSYPAIRLLKNASLAQTYRIATTPTNRSPNRERFLRVSDALPMKRSHEP
ncbi:MAG: hypothetical protein PUP93_18190 [Rhizonema sp. NSF051]|nr:hypothetical protein [Rhizonema sp. NSF051]